MPLADLPEAAFQITPHTVLDRAFLRSESVSLFLLLREI